MKRCLIILATFGAITYAQEVPSLGIATSIQIVAYDPVGLPKIGFTSSPEACFNYVYRDFSEAKYEPPSLEPPSDISGGASTFHRTLDACYVVPSDLDERPELIYEITQSFRLLGFELISESSSEPRIDQFWRDRLEIYSYSLTYDTSHDQGLLLMVDQWGD